MINIDIDKLTEGFDFSGYESPVKMFQEQIRIDVENDIMKAVRKVGVLVDKEELLKALKYDREQYEKGYMDGLNANKWIPVSERLPEKPEFCDKGYLVQEKHVCEPFSAYWDGEKWTDSDGFVLGEVLAWMPLPEPFREEGAK